MESPYRPPAESHKTGTAQHGPTKELWFRGGGFLVLPLLGAFIGFAGYIAAALLLEARDEVSGPRLSYGQQAGLISLPICTMIGAAIGFGIALSLARRYMFSVVLLLLVWLCSWRIVNSMWNDQIARYGRDPSEVVLYYPPLAFSVLALVTALTIGLVTAIRWRQT